MFFRFASVVLTICLLFDAFGMGIACRLLVPAELLNGCIFDPMIVERNSEFDAEPGYSVTRQNCNTLVKKDLFGAQPLLYYGRARSVCGANIQNTSWTSLECWPVAFCIPEPSEFFSYRTRVNAIPRSVFLSNWKTDSLGWGHVLQMTLILASSPPPAVQIANFKWTTNVSKRFIHNLHNSLLCKISGPNIHRYDDWSRLSALHHGPILFTLAGHQYTSELNATYNCTLSTNWLLFFRANGFGKVSTTMLANISSVNWIDKKKKKTEKHCSFFTKNLIYIHSKFKFRLHSARSARVLRSTSLHDIRLRTVGIGNRCATTRGTCEIRSNQLDGAVWRWRCFTRSSRIHRIHIRILKFVTETESHHFATF